MPTPSSNSPLFAPLSTIDAISTRTTCPPEGEIDRILWREPPLARIEQDTDEETTPTATSFANSAASSLNPADATQQEQQQPQPQPQPSASTSAQQNKDSVVADEDVTLAPAPLSPATSVSTEGKDELAVSPHTTSSVVGANASASYMSSLNYEFSNVRLLPDHTSSFLRSGSKFVGTQQSDRQIYNVDVEIKHVDIAESYLCGYLRIQGLTEDHPTLTTFFEGEIIGTKHTFITRHENWGATDDIDFKHWARFPAWRPLAKMAKKPDFSYKNFAQRENIFMRWKEYFLVPDHRVRTISGASFEGFYYICFNQYKGTVSGIYFHSKSEKYQQLELKHVENRGCFGAIEFR